MFLANIPVALKTLPGPHKLHEILLSPITLETKMAKKSHHILVASPEHTQRNKTDNISDQSPGIKPN